MAVRFLIFALATSATLFFFPVSGQITAPCTPSMITTFTPCINYVSNNSFNGSAPPADCCNSLKSLMGNGKDCLCLIATGSFPFRIPINRTLAISLPRSCNMPGVAFQCKTGAPTPAPAPGPVAANGPSISPNAAPSPSVSGLAPPEPLSPRSAPGADATPTPPAPTTSGGSPTSNRAGVTPSAAQPSHSFSPLLIVAMLGAITLKYY